MAGAVTAAAARRTRAGGRSPRARTRLAVDATAPPGGDSAWTVSSAAWLRRRPGPDEPAAPGAAATAAASAGTR